MKEFVGLEAVGWGMVIGVNKKSYKEFEREGREREGVRWRKGRERENY